MKHIYITGVSGTGKTTIANKLRERGVRAYSIDEEPGLCHWVNKADGTVVNYEAKLDREFINSHVWMCNVGQLKELIGHDGPVVVLGLAENQKEFFSLFDTVLLLQCRPEIFLQRIKDRTDNVFGQDASAQQYVLETYEAFEKEMLQCGAVPVSVEGPIGDVVDGIMTQLQ